MRGCAVVSEGMHVCACVCVSTRRSRGAVCHKTHSVIYPSVDVHWELRNNPLWRHGSTVRVCVCQQMECVCVLNCVLKCENVWRFAVGWWLPYSRLFALPAAACRTASWWDALPTHEQHSACVTLGQARKTAAGSCMWLHPVVRITLLLLSLPYSGCLLCHRLDLQFAWAVQSLCRRHCAEGNRWCPCSGSCSEVPACLSQLHSSRGAMLNSRHPWMCQQCMYKLV